MSGVADKRHIVPRLRQAIEQWKDEMFHQTPASLTTARAAIAETGTLVLWPDADEPRLMSLVPPVHIVLLDASQNLQHLLRSHAAGRLGKSHNPANQRPAHFRPLENGRHSGNAGLRCTWPERTCRPAMGEEA
jgi:L-lactate utilization protein LutC